MANIAEFIDKNTNPVVARFVIHNFSLNEILFSGPPRLRRFYQLINSIVL